MELHDNSASDNTPSPAESICDYRKNWHGDDGANRIDGVEETKWGAIWIAEIVFPLVRRLETVHKAPIVPGRC